MIPPISLIDPFPQNQPQNQISTHLLGRDGAARLAGLSRARASWLVVDAVVCLVCGVDLLVVLLDGTDDFLCYVLEGAVGGGGGGLLDLSGGHCDCCLFCLCEAKLEARSDVNEVRFD